MNRFSAIINTLLENNSQRLNEPTEGDIRRVATLRGYPPPVVYHGSAQQYHEFDERHIGSASDDGLFGRGFYFTPNRGTAERYAKNGGEVKEYYLKLQNPIVLNDFKTVNELAEYLGADPRILRMHDSGSAVPYVNHVRSFTSMVKGKSHDGVVIYHTESPSGVAEYVAFYPNQMKLVDTVTFDDDGNPIPLSRRFDSNSNDTRY